MTDWKAVTDRANTGGNAGRHHEKRHTWLAGRPPVESNRGCGQLSCNLCLL